VVTLITATSSIRHVRPQSVDWKTKGIVSTAKNQRSCGSYWAFGAVSGIQAMYTKQYGKPLYLSPQELVDCVSGNSAGCSGGFPENALNYAMNKD
jgi:C1A family cysteine protease